ncbi:MAG TPA: alpha/beta fold hydrolase [Candidatus Anoxymicrobiaceae bacterium]
MQLEIIERRAETKSSSLPVLFVHGAWHGAWCWEENFMPYFTERGFDCYAFSMRGHGGSGCEDRFHLSGIDDYVADLAAVVDRLGIDPALVGHSMGGLVVQRYLETHSAPAAVLLASVPPRGAVRFVGRVARMHPLVFLKYLVTQNPRTAVATPELTRDVFFSPDIRPEMLERYFSRIGTESARAALEMMALRFPRAGRVKGTPVLVLGAANDLVFCPAEVQATARAYGVQPQIFDEMAHDMMLEAGWQAVADRMIDWLREMER